MDAPLTTSCLQRTPPGLQAVYRDWQTIIEQSPGSSLKHQAWDSGYLDHVEECLGLSLLLYKTLDSQRSLPFTPSDVFVVLLLHDIEKPFKYASDDIQWESDARTDEFARLRKLAVDDSELLKQTIVQEYGIPLTQEQENAMTYIHGEGDDYSDGRVMNELAAFCHTCDILSARLWYAEPARSGPLRPLSN